MVNLDAEITRKDTEMEMKMEIAREDTDELIVDLLSIFGHLWIP